MKPQKFLRQNIQLGSKPFDVLHSIPTPSFAHIYRRGFKALSGCAVEVSCNWPQKPTGLKKRVNPRFYRPDKYIDFDRPQKPQTLDLGQALGPPRHPWKYTMNPRLTSVPTGRNWHRFRAEKFRATLGNSTCDFKRPGHPRHI